MLSFVVQNFYSQPFLSKTQRYNKLIISSNTHLLYLFIKESVQRSTDWQLTINQLGLSKFLLNKFFMKTFYKFFRKLSTSSLGVMTLNLTKSYMYKTFDDLNKLMIYKPILLPKKHHHFSSHKVKYLQPIIILSFAFQKKTYDTLMMYIIFLLVNSYTPSQNSFKLYYSFVIYSNSFSVYPFINLFYFKLRQF